MERIHLVGRSPDGRRLLLGRQAGEPASFEIAITDDLRNLVLEAGEALHEAAAGTDSTPDRTPEPIDPDPRQVGDTSHVRILPSPAAPSGDSGLTSAAMRRANSAPPRLPRLQGVRALIRETGGSGQAAALAHGPEVQAEGRVPHLRAEPRASPDPGGEPASMPPDAGVRAVASRLTPGEIQAMLRAGRSIPAVARAARAPVDWVRRLDEPIQNERRLVVTGMLHARLVRARLGTSPMPMGEAVGEHLRRRGIPESVMATGWSASRPASGSWRVRLTYQFRGRVRRADWEYRPAASVAHPMNRLASELGWPPKGSGRDRAPGTGVSG